MYTCVGTGELKSNTAKDSATFIKHTNNLLDTLNNNFLFDKNSLRCTLEENSVFDFLTSAKE